MLRQLSSVRQVRPKARPAPRGEVHTSSKVAPVVARVTANSCGLSSSPARAKLPQHERAYEVYSFVEVMLRLAIEATSP